MINRHIAVVLVVLFAAVSHAQSAAELLQKGIYSQETMGDLDGAIQIYRRAISTPGVPRQVAAQAQYQLVLCMLQKGDRNAASHELDLLARDFSDQQELIEKARKLVPGAGTPTAPPWSAGEASQLNIKRNGQFTGEYLYYSVTPWDKLNSTSISPFVNIAQTPNSRDLQRAQSVYLGWNLVTKNSSRGIQVLVDRTTLLRPAPPADPSASGTSIWEHDRVFSDDISGDPLAVPFAGPAIDAEPLVFQMRTMPLAVGYKRTFTILPFVLGQRVPRTVELAVTAVEPVQTVAGKFSCYKVVFASLGQTFWFTVDSAHALVKFQSGDVEAELVKIWGPTAIEDGLSFLKKAGWSVNSLQYSLQEGSARAEPSRNGKYVGNSVSIRMWRLYMPPQEIANSLRKACDDAAARVSTNGVTATVRPSTVQANTFGGHPAVSCIIDTRSEGKDTGSEFSIFVRSESFLFQFSLGSYYAAVFRWEFEPILDTIKIP